MRFIDNVKENFVKEIAKEASSYTPSDTQSDIVALKRAVQLVFDGLELFQNKALTQDQLNSVVSQLSTIQENIEDLADRISHLEKTSASARG